LIEQALERGGFRVKLLGLGRMLIAAGNGAPQSLPKIGANVSQ
jgi:hypothetical protein